MNRYRLIYLLSVLLWLALIVALLVVPVKSQEAPAESPPSAADLTLDAVLSFADVTAEAREPQTYEDLFRESASVIPDCIITHYCVEQYPHICGTGDGITATGVPATADWTCAVDPSIIPYGSEVMVDYGDSVAFYKAQDCGGAVQGNHIDLAVESHAEALERGLTTATVYFKEANE